MANIFISYRREDSAGYAGRLCDRLNRVLGQDRVFMDVEDIQPGQDFVVAIEQTMAACDVVIAVIGPRWLSTLRERLNHGEDFVREEIAAALKRKVTVIPVLVGGASMPGSADLPESLADLSRHNAVDIRDSQFDEGVGRLTKFLTRLPGVGIDAGSQRRRWMVPVMIAVVAAAGILFWLLSPPKPPDLNGRWIAEMQKEGQRPYRIRLNLVAAEDRLSGSVVYPTGEGAIQDGKINRGRISFHTTHVPQFASEPATIRFEGEILKDSIRLTVSSDSGVVTGVASRAAR